MRLIKGEGRESTKKKEIESCKNDRAEKNDFFTGMDYKLNKSLWSFGDRFQRNGSSCFLHRQTSSALPPPIGGVFRRKDEEGLLFILNVVFSSSSPGGIIAACGKEEGGLLPPPPPPWQLRQAREVHHLCRSADRRENVVVGNIFPKDAHSWIAKQHSLKIELSFLLTTRVLGILPNFLLEFRRR